MPPAASLKPRGAIAPTGALVLAAQVILAVVAPASGLAAVDGAAGRGELVRRESGAVRFVTQQRIYLDRGGRDGLVLGQELQLWRAGRPVGRCKIAELADHLGTCHQAGPRSEVRRGDRFRTRRRVEVGPASPAKSAHPLPAVLTEQTLQQRAAALASAPHQRVDFVDRGRAGRAASAVIDMGSTLWAAGVGTGSRSWSDQIDVQLRRVPLGQTGMRFDAAFSAVRWQDRSAATRFSPGSAAQFLVWEAEISRRERDSATVFALGRLWPWHLPGIAVLDGVQIGRRNEGGSREWGGYAGTVPDALLIRPSTDAWTTGVYAAFTQAGAAGGPLAFSREELRVGLRHSTTAGLVKEAEALGETALGGAWVTAAGLRLAQATAVERGVVLEQAHLVIRTRRTRRTHRTGTPVDGWIQLRHLGLAPEQTAILRNEVASLRGGSHASFGGDWNVGPALSLNILANLHRDEQSGLSAFDAQLEARLPEGLGRWGGLWMGMAAGEGWLRSRTAYLQLVLHPADNLRVVGRVTGSTTALKVGDGTVSDAAELGSLVYVDAGLASWLRVRGRGLLHTPLRIQGQPPTGVTSGLVAALDAILFF